MKTSIRIEAKGPFALAASRAFLCGFTPGAGSADTATDRLILAFRLDGTFEPVAVAVSQNGAVVEGSVRGTRDLEAASRQTARILSLDHDAAGYARLGEKDPVIGGLQSADPGFRPVCFPSPYEAALWGLLAQRVPMKRAADIKRALARELGDTVEIEATTMHVTPHPERLLALETFPGLPLVKVDRLRALGRAALDGRLDIDRLRGMTPDAAVESLLALPGVGPWTAQHIVMRGCGPADALPTSEPRVFEAVRRAYDLAKAPGETELARIAENWRPWRMWVSVLLVRALAGTEGWNVRRGKKSGTVAA
jgi:DNA-3-methyladenine glycosylase II